MTTSPADAARPERSRLAEVLRWLGVLPVALIASTIVNYVFKIVVMFGLIRLPLLRELEFAYWICYALVLVPKNVVFVLAGAVMAPRARPVAAAAMAAIACLMALTIHLLGRGSPGLKNWQDFAVESAGAILTAAVIALASRRKRAARLAAGNHSE